MGMGMCTRRISRSLHERRKYNQIFNRIALRNSDIYEILKSVAIFLGYTSWIQDNILGQGCGRIA